MAISEVEVVKAPAKVKSDDGEWSHLGVYMARLEYYDSETVLDVLKLTVRTSKMKNAPIKSLSNETYAIKDDLERDPFNLKLVNNLAAAYLKECQHDRALHVLMRGWKRASEISDEKVRFRFLMKVGELSMGMFMYRQALAVFRDIKEPTDGNDLTSYLMMGTQVWSANGDVTQSLKLFQRSLEGVDSQRALRIFAIVAADLRKAGVFEAAKSTMENIMGTTVAGKEDPDLNMIDEFFRMRAENLSKRELTPAQHQKRVTIVLVAFSVLIVIMMLWWLESKSLASLK